MYRGSHLHARPALLASMLAVIALAAWVLLAGKAEPPQLSAASEAALRRSAGYPQLVSVEPLPAMESAMCQWVPASARTTLLAGLQEGSRPKTAAPSASADTRTPTEIDRAPLRAIRDTYPGYSAVAVNTTSDEVFLQDENLFGVKVFNRLDNTPPKASFTEPKRVLSGPKTTMEYNCSLYVDPHSGDIYSLSNDTVDTLAVFPHDAKGNVAPMRALATPQSTFGLAVDEEHQELFMSVQQTSSVVVYRKMATGKEAPLRQLFGEHTQLADPHGIVVDPKNDLLFVNNAGNTHSWDSAGKPIPASGRFSPPSITVYRLKASGDTAPLRVIQGPKTQLNWAAGMYLDQDHEELYVANDGADSVLVFRESDGGDAAPVRVLKGSKTGLKNPTAVFVDGKNDELWIANFGNHTARVYQRTANGDVAPLRTIRSAPATQPAIVFANPAAVGYDSKRDEILVPN